MSVKLSIFINSSVQFLTSILMIGSSKALYKAKLSFYKTLLVSFCVYIFKYNNHCPKFDIWCLNIYWGFRVRLFITFTVDFFWVPLKGSTLTWNKSNNYSSNTPYNNLTFILYVAFGKICKFLNFNYAISLNYVYENSYVLCFISCDFLLTWAIK